MARIFKFRRPEISQTKPSSYNIPYAPSRQEEDKTDKGLRQSRQRAALAGDIVDLTTKVATNPIMGLLGFLGKETKDDGDQKVDPGTGLGLGEGILTESEKATVPVAPEEEPATPAAEEIAPKEEPKPPSIEEVRAAITQQTDAAAEALRNDDYEAAVLATENALQNQANFVTAARATFEEDKADRMVAEAAKTAHVPFIQAAFALEMRGKTGDYEVAKAYLTKAADIFERNNPGTSFADVLEGAKKSGTKGAWGKSGVSAALAGKKGKGREERLEFLNHKVTQAWLNERKAAAEEAAAEEAAAETAPDAAETAPEAPAVDKETRRARSAVAAERKAVKEAEASLPDFEAELERRKAALDRARTSYYRKQRIAAEQSADFEGRDAYTPEAIPPGTFSEEEQAIIEQQQAIEDQKRIIGKAKAKLRAAQSRLTAPEAPEEAAVDIGAPDPDKPEMAVEVTPGMEAHVAPQEERQRKLTMSELASEPQPEDVPAEVEVEAVPEVDVEAAAKADAVDAKEKQDRLTPVESAEKTIRESNSAYKKSEELANSEKPEDQNKAEGLATIMGVYNYGVKVVNSKLEDLKIDGVGVKVHDDGTISIDASKETIAKLGELAKKNPNHLAIQALRSMAGAVQGFNTRLAQKAGIVSGDLVIRTDRDFARNAGAGISDYAKLTDDDIIARGMAYAESFVGKYDPLPANLPSSFSGYLSLASSLNLSPTDKARMMDSLKSLDITPTNLATAGLFAWLPGWELPYQKALMDAFAVGAASTSMKMDRAEKFSMALFNARAAAAAKSPTEFEKLMQQAQLSFVKAKTRRANAQAEKLEKKTGSKSGSRRFSSKTIDKDLKARNAQFKLWQKTDPQKQADSDATIQEGIIREQGSIFLGRSATADTIKKEVKKTSASDLQNTVRTNSQKLLTDINTTLGSKAIEGNAEARDALSTLQKQVREGKRITAILPKAAAQNVKTSYNATIEAQNKLRAYNVLVGSGGDVGAIAEHEKAVNTAGRIKGLSTQQLSDRAGAAKELQSMLGSLVLRRKRADPKDPQDAKFIAAFDSRYNELFVSDTWLTSPDEYLRIFRTVNNTGISKEEQALRADAVMD